MRRLLIIGLLLHQVGCSTNQNGALNPVERGSAKMISYPNPENWEHANVRQRERATRSFAELAKRQVPAFQGPLFIDDDEEISLQTPQDVARRALVLWAVVMRAEGMPLEEARELIDQQGLWDSVSSREKAFLNDRNPDDAQKQALVWRLESVWLLMWALGYIDELPWPGSMCEVPELARLVSKHEDNPAFISEARLRPVAELLDAQDLTMRIHWAIRDAYLHQDGMIPETLDWSGNPEYVPIQLSAAVGVVEQRHYVLNWLVNFLNPESWDDVDTPT